MRYQAYVDEVPTKDAYRLSYSPREGYGTTIVCPWVVVTGESGTTYQFMRCYGMPQLTNVLNFGAFRGTGELDKQAPLVIPFSETPAVEPFEISETADAVVYAASDHTLTLGPDGYHWRDAGGRIDLRAHLVGQPVTFWVPAQEGFTAPMLSRSHLGTVSGTIDGDPVEGLWTHDHMYSTPGLNFQQTLFTQEIHNFWMNWWIEYDDGSTEGGFAWRGRPGTGFAAAHHYVDGRSHARTDARLSFDFTERGSIEKFTLKLGRDLTVEFTQNGSLDWPIHTYGTATSSSRDKKIVKSWNYTEHFPHNFGLVEDYQIAHANLFGRYPSLRGLMDQATVQDGSLRFGR